MKEQIPMKRRDRLVSDPEQIFDIVWRCPVLRLAFPDEDAPYIVPFSFGVEKDGENIVFYVHCAKIGRKIDLIGGGCRAGVELDNFLGYGGGGRKSVTYYESIIGSGMMERVEGEEAQHGMELLMEHCGLEKQNFAECLPHTAVFRVTVDDYAAKANLKPE